jgi:hypothetical protein
MGGALDVGNTNFGEKNESNNVYSLIKISVR